MTVQQDVSTFLMRHGAHERFCASCLMTAIGLRNIRSVQRAMKALAHDPGCLLEEAECSKCNGTGLTIRGLWTGMIDPRW